jgi:hypothetical protein
LYSSELKWSQENFEANAHTTEKIMCTNISYF